MIRNSKILKVISTILLISTLCGCSKNSNEEIALVEPVAINTAYCPVFRTDVGKTEKLAATVVPTMYCNFYKTGVKIDKIVVEVGQYVKSGDIIAYANHSDLNNQLMDKKEALDIENKIYDLNSKIADTMIDQLQEQNQDETINTIKENIRYDKILHEHKVENMKEEMQALEASVKNTVLRANHDGYVCFVKNIGIESEAQANENIVMIADMTDKYLEVNSTVAQYKYADFELKYLIKDGVKHDITEIDYTPQELILSKIKDSYPLVRMRCTDNAELEVGDTYLLVFSEKATINTLVVNKSSVFKENGQSFVYVRTDSGKKERRNITTGDSDNNYTAVLDGLVEDEMVYYESQDVIPEVKNEYTVEYSDYKIENHCANYKVASGFSYQYSADCDGIISKVAVSSGNEVKTGDLLYIIDSGEGKAELMEAEHAMEGEIEAFKNITKDYKDNLAAADNKNSKQLLEYQYKISEIYHNNTLKNLTNNYETLKKNNNGTGLISVYAQHDGIIGSLNITKESNVKVGDKILSVNVEGEKKLMMSLIDNKQTMVYLDNIADLQEKVTATVDDITYSAKCIGFNVSESAMKVYPCTIDGNAYLSFCTSSGYNEESFYVELEDKGMYDKLPAGLVFSFNIFHSDKSIVLSNDYIYSEIRSSEPGKESKYVWQVINGQAVKKYILVDEISSYYDTSKSVVLRGLSAGDVIVME